MTSNPVSPFRAAIIGSGPSAFYAADALLSYQGAAPIEVDMFERLPTPFGLVRGGVAPDHAKIKSVTKVYDKTATRPNFRFYGNVTFGTDIFYADLLQHYHVIVYATGAQTDRSMGIPGEDLPGSHAATEFVGWYNGHPDYRHLTFDLSQERAAVIGNGNVAVDVARILAQSDAVLSKTDIADYALDALRHSRVREIYILGRRGPVQAKFTSMELKEMGQLEDADLIVDPHEVELDPLSADYLKTENDRVASTNYRLFSEFAARPLRGKPKQIILRFLVSPVEIIGQKRVEALRLVKNEICLKEHFLNPCPTEETETLPVGLVFRSIGYHGVALPDVPFAPRSGTIPNVKGRVMDLEGVPRVGEYAVGWIKRGPSGIIGTNKGDANETAALIVEDIERTHVLNPPDPSREAIVNLLHGRGVRFVTYDDWRAINRLETARGEPLGRPRVKFTCVEEMLAALESQRVGEPGD